MSNEPEQTNEQQGNLDLDAPDLVSNAPTAPEEYTPEPVPPTKEEDNGDLKDENFSINNTISDLDDLIEEAPLAPDLDEEVKEPEEVKKEKDKVTYNAVVSDDYSIEGSISDLDPIPLPSIPLDDFNEKISGFIDIKDEDVTPEMMTWKNNAEKSIEYYTPYGLYQTRFTDTGSVFRQGVLGNDDKLATIGPVNFNFKEGELKGEVALLKVTKKLGLGDVIVIPLPHSGLWVTIKPPSERDLIDFYNTMFREKILLGRTTFGLTLTNFSVHVNNALFDFISSHIHSINNRDIPIDELRDKLVIHDYHILVWGFICSLYPNGYNYERDCSTDISKCTHRTSAKLNLNKLLWIDNSALSETQKTILYDNKAMKMTLAHYDKYMNEHKLVINKSIVLSNGIKIYLKVPTFAEHIRDGFSWVNAINNKIESMLVTPSGHGVDTEEDDSVKQQRLEHLSKYVKSSVLRQHAHFIQKLEVDGNTISDRDTVNNVLNVLSGEDDIRIEINDAILKFKSETTIGIIGIPEYRCPSCGESQRVESAGERFTSVIPLDVLGIVFLFLTSKISRILDREV